MPVLSLHQRLREGQRLVRREARGLLNTWEVDDGLIELCVGATLDEVAALVRNLPPGYLGRLQKRLSRYPTSETAWASFPWASGSIGITSLAARSLDEFRRLERDRMEAAKQRFRRGVEALRGWLAAVSGT